MASKDVITLIKKIHKQLDIILDKINQYEQKQIGEYNSAELCKSKPILKWLGGKTQIINHILDKTPNVFNNYHEIFVGGGSVLLGILALRNSNQIRIKGNINAYDANRGLINMYKHIQNNPQQLHEYIQSYINRYELCPMTKKNLNRNPLTLSDGMISKENYYYWLRNNFNSMDKYTIEYSALFIVINKLTFRGMYREGPNGFNVPFGNYKTTPKMITLDEMQILSDLIKDVNFTWCDFTESIKSVKKGDYVYLDPPYAPENNKSFVSYNIDGFNTSQHMKLFDLIKSTKNIKFCMSNSNVKMVSDNFLDDAYNKTVIKCKRSINSKNPESTTEELIITNYNLKVN